MLKAFSAVANAIRTAVGGLLQIAGPSAGATRTMTVPDADFTAARTDAANTFTGAQTLGNAAASVEAKLNVQPTLVSVSTSATTIVTNAGALGSFVIVNGISSGDRFCDLLMASTGAAPVVVQSFTAIGSPAARTYSRSASALQLQMASGTYSVVAITIGY
jgi:hypothetical protein